MHKRMLKCGEFNLYSGRNTLIQVFFLYAWISLLPKTDSFFSVYSFFAVAGLCCLMLNRQRQTICSGRNFWGAVPFSVAFSLSAILGNYMLFEPITALMSLFNMGLCFVGGIVIAQNILLWLLESLPLKLDPENRKKEKLVFFGTFLCTVAVDLMYLFFTNYPAILDWDTISELAQAIGSMHYSKWTPYWHTKTLEFILNPAYAVLGDLNAALACVTVCQVLFFAACFAYAVVTLYQLGLPKPVLWGAFYIYALYPYNIAFNITPSKDMAFGVALLLMLTALLRILTGTGKNSRLNYLMLIVGSLGFCLWRTNGIYVYLVTAVVLLLKWGKSRKWLVTIMLCIAVVCMFLSGPYLDGKTYQEIPFTETMAIPFQQIGRILLNERELSEEDTGFLEEIFYLDRVQELYTPESADAMKFDVIRSEQIPYLEENIGRFLKMWLRLGFEYPADYLRAWVDETRGYWNGGYHMGVYDQGIPDNMYGFESSGGGNLIDRLFAAYFRYIEDPVILEPLKSIGFAVWLVLACWWINILKKRQVSVLMVPVLVLLVGLWIGTPVFAEFRYGYPVFLVSPMIILTTVYGEKTE